MKDNKIETLEDLYDRAYNNALKDSVKALPDKQPKNEGLYTNTIFNKGYNNCLSKAKKSINNLRRSR